MERSQQPFAILPNVIIEPAAKFVSLLEEPVAGVGAQIPGRVGVFIVQLIRAHFAVPTLRTVCGCQAAPEQETA